MFVINFRTVVLAPLRLASFFSPLLRNQLRFGGMLGPVGGIKAQNEHYENVNRQNGLIENNCVL